MATAEDSRRVIEEKFQKFQASFTGLGSVSSEELRDMILAGTPLTLVDCRDEEEQRVSMIKGSVAEQQLNVDSLDRDATVVTYCTAGKRSGDFALKLKSRNFTKVFNSPGIVSFSHVAPELLIEPATNAPTRRVHTWSATFAFTGEGVEAVYPAPGIVQRSLAAVTGIFSRS
eukprot:TRINITY_DN74049_c0_g1_i1.p1 TRINITY_DN74049_c0_g1~~TRINITY_DN74049_c0_g1_i1.p1  ORF type:complete len:182 (-),score=26.63 TRINITY_DN74049_c0_g1_i1:103-618(-)